MPKNNEEIEEPRLLYTYFLQVDLPLRREEDSDGGPKGSIIENPFAIYLKEDVEKYVERIRSASHKEIRDFLWQSDILKMSIKDFDQLILKFDERFPQ